MCVCVCTRSLHQICHLTEKKLTYISLTGFFSFLFQLVLSRSDFSPSVADWALYASFHSVQNDFGLTVEGFHRDEMGVGPFCPSLIVYWSHCV